MFSASTACGSHLRDCKGLVLPSPCNLSLVVYSDDGFARMVFAAVISDQPD